MGAFFASLHIFIYRKENVYILETLLDQAQTFYTDGQALKSAQQTTHPTYPMYKVTHSANFNLQGPSYREPLV